MPPSRADVTGVVLCGGASRRMGRDKAALRLGDADLLDRAVAALAPHASEVLLACGEAPRYADRGLRLVLDARPDGGPLEALRAALAAADTPWILALACDMPRAAGALGGLLAGARPGDQVVHYSVNGAPEPLCALYARSILPAVEAALERGERRAVAFWPAVRVRALDASTARPFTKLNTPDDLARARADLE